MGLLLRSKLLDQATAKAKQKRFFVRGSARGEWGGPENRAGDGENRRRGTTAMGREGEGESQEAPAGPNLASACQSLGVNLDAHGMPWGLLAGADNQTMEEALGKSSVARSVASRPTFPPLVPVPSTSDPDPYVPDSNPGPGCCAIGPWPGSDPTRQQPPPQR